ncbi:MAG TPA: hypothetical protein VG714_10095 [Acidobacteriaceae bacterium]|nr:hypothetical protein [Acidobacteriaceae bacterium]
MTRRTYCLVLWLLLASPFAGVPPAHAANPQAAATAQSSATASPAAKKPASDDDDDKDDDKHSPIPPDEVHHPVLWHDPGNIASRDLLHGQGGTEDEPKPPFKFLEEDHRQSTPKFDARDANGKKWRVKLGGESRPEVVISRLLWAVGYYVEDDYVLAAATIPGIHMKRGNQYIHGQQIADARFARKPGDEKKIATWRWKSNPFSGTRELNGLRVMMALVNSWDLKDENNAVYSDKKHDRQLFLVSDTGSSFGRTGLHFVNSLSKDNVKAYAKSKFITHTTPTTVSFATPAPSLSLLLETLGFGIKQYLRRNSMLWIGRKIPREDARWIGGLLGQLTHRQLVDAFRAGDYPPEQIDQFVTVVEARIHQLNAL